MFSQLGDLVPLESAVSHMGMAILGPHEREEHPAAIAAMNHTHVGIFIVYIFIPTWNDDMMI
jgi:hypothetical protein